MNVSSIERSFDNYTYEINNWNADFDDSPFDDDESLITRQQIYRIHKDIIEKLNNGLSIDVYMNRM